MAVYATTVSDKHTLAIGFSFYRILKQHLAQSEINVIKSNIDVQNLPIVDIYVTRCEKMTHFRHYVNNNFGSSSHTGDNSC